MVIVVPLYSLGEKKPKSQKKAFEAVTELYFLILQWLPQVGESKSQITSLEK